MIRIFNKNILSDYELNTYNNDIAYFYRKRCEQLEKENYKLYCATIKLQRKNEWLESHQKIEIITGEIEEK